MPAPGDVPAALDAILQAVSGGELAPGEAASVVRVVDSLARALAGGVEVRLVTEDAGAVHESLRRKLDELSERLLD